MPTRTPALVITFPQPNAIVGTSPFNVTGTVTAPGMPEPVAINSVTVQVNGQAPIRATLKRIANSKLVEVTFSATVHITSGQDPHTITVTVASDAGTVIRAVSVVAGLTFVPQPPAILIDFSLPQVQDLPLGDIVSRLQPLASGLAKQLSGTPVIGHLGALHKILVGPNLLLVNAPQPMLRFGLWILDSSFPKQDLVAATKDFALAPLLNPPAVGSEASTPPAELTVAGFALSVPTTTLQTILDALKPDIVSSAADHHFSVDTAIIKTSAPGTVITTLSGSLPAGISMTATITETLGIAQRSSTVLSKMPTVISSHGSTSIGDDLDWFIGAGARNRARPRWPVHRDQHRRQQRRRPGCRNSY